MFSKWSSIIIKLETLRELSLGHTLNTQILMKTDEQKTVLGKFTILCWPVGWTALKL